MRKALQTAATVAIDTTLTPVYSGAEWYGKSLSYERSLYYKNDVSSDLVYTDSETPLMNGVKIIKDASQGNKYVMVYSRNLTVKDVIAKENTPFYGFGLRPETPNPTTYGILPYNGWENVIIHGSHYNKNADGSSSGCRGSVDNFTKYKGFLEDAGLYPAASNIIRPVHNMDIMDIADAGTNKNIMSNGIYDFVLAYYNPKGDGTFHGADTDLSARLPSWPTSGLEFNGLDLPSGATPQRTIDGISADSMSRKGNKQTTGTPASHATQAGEPRTDFINNITVPMANYMASDLHINAFKNTNILGDGNEWITGGGIIVGGSSAVKNLSLIPSTNIGLVGNYNNFSEISGSFERVLDIKGVLPEAVTRSFNRECYLNLWSNVQSNGIIITKMSVVNIHGNGKDYVYSTTANGDTSRVGVIIYPTKHSSLNPIAKSNNPLYRAFMDGTTPKITPAANSEFRTAYPDHIGSDTTGSQLVPSLIESEWLDGTNSTSQNYTSAPKWTKADFDAVPVASIAPAPLGTRIAAVGRQAIEAVLPAKKRSRFEDAYLAELGRQGHLLG